MRYVECAVLEAECCAVDKVEVYDTVPWRKVPLYSILFLRCFDVTREPESLNDRFC